MSVTLNIKIGKVIRASAIFLIFVSTSCIPDNKIIGEWLECRISNCVLLRLGGYKFDDNGKYVGLAISSGEKWDRVKFSESSKLYGSGNYKYQSRRLTLYDNQTLRTQHAEVEINGDISIWAFTANTRYFRRMKSANGNIQYDFSVTKLDLKYVHDRKLECPDKQVSTGGKCRVNGTTICHGGPQAHTCDGQSAGYLKCICDKNEWYCVNWACGNHCPFTYVIAQSGPACQVKNSKLSGTCYYTQSSGLCDCSNGKIVCN